MRNSKTRQMAMDAVSAALCAVLGYLSLDLGSVKITFESLPILMGALLFGPVDGIVIGAIGTFLCQFLRYGITATTVLWMMPYMVMGFAAGRYAMKRRFRLNRKQIFFIVTAAEIMVSVMNTGVLFVDSMIYGYYSAVYVFGMLALRIPICVVKSCAFGMLIPGIVGSIRRGLRLWPKEETDQ